MARARGYRSLLVGVDGSVHSRRAVAFVTRLAAPPGGRVTVVRVVEPARLPSMGLLPASVRAELGGQAAALDAARVRAARREAETAAHELARAGWRARAEVRSGVPVEELLKAARAHRADLIVLGARGTGGVARLLLGSVADSATRRSPIPVLIVR